MNEQIKQISARIREMREILGCTPEQIAAAVGISVEQYLRYEGALDDIPIGVLYGIAAHMGVDYTELLTGEAPRMADYTVVRQGRGVSVERFAGYSFNSLAFNYIGREMEPMIVDISSSDKAADMVTHGGQEFNYVLAGVVEVTVGTHAITLRSGDSIYFDPRIPHAQRAVEGQARFLTVINER